MKQFMLLYFIVFMLVQCQEANAADSVNKSVMHHSLKAHVLSTIHLNTATVVQLQALKGIGLKKAQAIVGYRKAHGSFTKIDGLSHVRGIGSKFLARLKKDNHHLVL